jgi:hypothetical protein
LYIQPEEIECANDEKLSGKCPDCRWMWYEMKSKKGHLEHEKTMKP